MTIDLKHLMDAMITSDLTSNQRMLLIVINMADGERISYSEIAHKTLMSTATVARLLAQIKSKGWISWEKTEQTDPRPNKYIIQIPSTTVS